MFRKAFASIDFYIIMFNFDRRFNDFTQASHSPRALTARRVLLVILPMSTFPLSIKSCEKKSTVMPFHVEVECRGMAA